MNQLAEKASHAGVELPPLSDSVIDLNTVTALFADLEAFTEVLEVRLKGSATQYVGENQCTLETAMQLIKTRAVRGVQIRYIYEQSQWWDTLVVTPNEIRIVRIRPDFAN